MYLQMWCFLPSAMWIFLPIIEKFTLETCAQSEFVQNMTNWKTLDWFVGSIYQTSSHLILVRSRGSSGCWSGFWNRSQEIQGDWSLGLFIVVVVVIINGCFGAGGFGLQIKQIWINKTKQTKQNKQKQNKIMRKIRWLSS